MALRYFLVEKQIPELTYVRTTATAMLQSYHDDDDICDGRARPDFKLKDFEENKLIC